MATASKREVTLGVGIKTTGDENLRATAAEIRKLAAEGDPAAAEFRALADQLDRLANQVDAVQGLRALNVEIDRLAANQAEAAASAIAARQALQSQAASATALREAQAQAAQAVAAGTVRLQEARGAIRVLAAEYDAAGKRTQEYRDKLVGAQQAVTAAQGGLTGLKSALTAANVAAAAAVNEESRLSAAYLRSSEAASRADSAVRERAVAMRAAEQAATALGVETTDLAQAEGVLLNVQASLVAQEGQLRAARAARLALDEQSAAAQAALADRIRATAAAYDQEQAALAETAAISARAAAEKQRLVVAAEQAAAAERAEAAAAAALSAKRREQVEADLLAAQAASGLADARARGRLAAESELAAIKDSEEFTRRYAQAQREAAVAVEAEGVDAMRKLEAASRAADKAQEALVQSLRETEVAAEKYAAAIGKAAAAGEQDVAAMAERRAAAEALIASESRLTAEQREAAAARDKSRAALVAEAQALLASARAADESRAATARLVRESIALGSTLDGTGKSVSRIGELTRNAFGTVGVRSLQDIETEIRQVDVATSLLERKFRAGQISADDLARAVGSASVRLAVLKNEAAQVPALPGQFERISDSIQGVITRFGALGAAVATVGIAVRPVLEATIALDQMRRTLTTVTGSSEEAERQIDFLRKTAQQSGQSFTESGAAYAKFAASALQSGLTINQVQDAFKSVSLAAGNLGLSSDQTKRALEALSQMASKGVVSMEELRQQLGDALPGVLPLLAKELGLTQQELGKVVESGNLLALEAIPAIGRALVSLQPQDGVINGLVATWNRFKNVVMEAGTTITEGPLGSAAGVVLTAFGGVIRDLAVVGVSASEAMKLFGLSTLSVLDALRGNISIEQLKTQLNDFAVQSGERIQKFKDTAYGAGDGLKALSAESTKAGGSFAALALESQKAIDKAELNAQSSEKNTQAKRQEGEAAIVLAGLMGDETAARDAAFISAQRNLDAAKLQQAADQGVVDSLTRAKAALLERAQAEGLGTEATKTAIAALDEKIAKATADAEKTVASTEAARAQVLAMQLSTAAARDNSGRIAELRTNVADLAAAQERSKIAMVEGTGTEAQAKAATDALAVAKGLLKDAINDVDEALQRQIKSMQADAALATAGIKLEIERQKNIQQSATLAGNEYKARQAGIAVKEAELRLAAIGTDTKTKEVEATLLALDVQERELRALGQLTPEKAIEIETRRKTAIALQLEAAATNESGAAKRKELADLQAGKTARDAATGSTAGNTRATSDNTSGVRENSGALKEQSGVLGTLPGALEKVSAARAKYNALLVASRGFEGLGVSGGSGLAGIKDPRLSDINGVDGIREAGGTDNLLADQGGKNLSVLTKNNAPPVDNTGMFALIDKLEKGTLNLDDLGAARSALAAARNNSFMTANSSIGSSRLGEYTAIEAKLAAAVQKLEYMEAGRRARENDAAGVPRTPFGGVSRTVNVNLNVGGRKVQGSFSDSSATELINALETAQRGTGGLS